MTSHIKQLPWWKWTLLLIGSIVLASIGYALIDFGYNKASDLQHLTLTIITTIITVVLVLGIYALIRGFRKELPDELKLVSLIPHTLLGLAIGFVYVTLVVSTIWALGFADVSWQSFSWSQQLKGILFFLGVAVGEEIIFRGVIFRMFDERWNTTVAFIVSALAFCIFYYCPKSVDAVIIVPEEYVYIVMGLMLAAAYKWSGTLWLPIGIHWAWRYVQFNIYGLPIGRVAGQYIFSTTLSGITYRHETIFVSPWEIIGFIYGILITAIFLFLSYRRSSRRKR